MISFAFLELDPPLDFAVAAAASTVHLNREEFKRGSLGSRILEVNMAIIEGFLSLGSVSQLLLLTAAFLSLIQWLRRVFKKTEIPSGKLPIPTVSGGLPLIGHGLYLFTDILQFVRNCHEKYGGIFSVKLFRTRIVICCDPRLSNTYFKEQEENLSLNQELKLLNFDWPFYESDFSLSNVIEFFRKSIAVKYDVMIPKIESEAKRVIERLESKVEGNGGTYECSIEDEAYRFIARTSHSCFISSELTDEVLAAMRKFFSFVNFLVLSSYFIPGYVMERLAKWRVRQLRRSLSNYFDAVVQSYREEPLKSDSLLIRSAIDFTDLNGNKLSNSYIVDLIVGFMFVSSENTSVGLANAITYMAMPENWSLLQKLRLECGEYLGKGDAAGLLKAPFLNACVMEMARLSAHLFAIQRRPMSSVSSIGEYHVGKEIESVALSGQMLMVHSENSRYSNALVFDPMRYFGKNKELATSPSIVTWGGGLHLCPGRMFALYEIKFALAYIVTRFELELVDKVGNVEFDYFSPIAFAKRSMRIRLGRREVG